MKASLSDEKEPNPVTKCTENFNKIFGIFEVRPNNFLLWKYKNGFVTCLFVHPEQRFANGHEKANVFILFLAKEKPDNKRNNQNGCFYSTITKT